jgi:hypothetical protein
MWRAPREALELARIVTAAGKPGVGYQRQEGPEYFMLERVPVVGRVDRRPPRLPNRRIKDN